MEVGGLLAHKRSMSLPKDLQDKYWRDYSSREVFRGNRLTLIRKLVFYAAGRYDKRRNPFQPYGPIQSCTAKDDHVERDCCPDSANVEFDGSGTYTCFVCNSKWTIVGMYGYFRKCCFD